MKQGGTADKCFYSFLIECIFIPESIFCDKINGNSPYSISYMKRMIRETDGENMSVGFQKEVGVVYEGILGPDFAERISVLNQKK